MIYSCLIFISVIYCTLHYVNCFILFLGVKTTNHKPCIIITITYTLMREHGGVILCACFCYHTKRIHILICDLWLIIKKVFLCPLLTLTVLWSILMVFARKNAHKNVTINYEIHNCTLRINQLLFCAFLSFLPCLTATRHDDAIQVLQFTQAKKDGNLWI